MFYVRTKGKRETETLTDICKRAVDIGNASECSTSFMHSTRLKSNFCSVDPISPYGESNTICCNNQSNYTNEQSLSRLNIHLFGFSFFSHSPLPFASTCFLWRTAVFTEYRTVDDSEEKFPK